MTTIAGIFDLVDQPLIARLSQMNRDNGGTVQNHGLIAFRTEP